MLKDHTEKLLNLPQAYSHVAIIESAIMLSSASP